MEIENERLRTQCAEMAAEIERLRYVAAQSIPKGYKLVSESLTKEMKNAGRSVKIEYGLFGEDEPLYTSCSNSEIEKVWGALLSAFSSHHDGMRGGN